MTGELDGLNRLVFDGPFKCSLLNKTEVPVHNLVIVSRNGEVSKLPVNLVPGVQDAVHGVLLDLAKNQATAVGLERLLLDGGAVSLGNGLFWLKSEAKIFSSVIPRKEEKPKTIQEFRAIARKMTFD